MSNFKRAAIAMGYRKSDTPTPALRPDLQDLYLDGIEHPIGPTIVKDAPCKKNKAFANECDLFKFPAPLIHEGDGGRYMCTWHLVATKDKSSSCINWGMYRAMILNQRTLVGPMAPLSHGALMYFNQYEPADEPMPFSIAIGADSLSLLAACNPIPYGVSEMDVVGGWRGEPLEVVKCETNDLLVPASAEVVIEGIIPPKRRENEGPFAEYAGYGGGGGVPRLVYEVSCMTWRDDPILPMSNMGMPVHEANIFTSMGYEGVIKKALRDAGIPVKAVNLVPEAASCMLVISAKITMPRVANRIMALINSMPFSSWQYKFLICDEDVDVFNLAEVVHAWTTKCHPERGIWIEHQMSSPVCPYAASDERRKMIAPTVMFDCTWPADWPREHVPPKASFLQIYPKWIQEKVLNKWTEYGLK